ncbi:hypothetical protein BDP27DRAFT_1401125 [Rhodocollybia butyracea]|uniref:Uncharacterized protein n=1 Tax=Rhodocollybia butyracea TaxID=206335 RepID=A0A9P5PZC7_9AGAR|nr:hypothetical protein BDP27DRAFT_1401125 [Rhodocollybia butyracea]
MQSVTRYSKIQTITWLRLIFPLLFFIASVAYAAPITSQVTGQATNNAPNHIRHLPSPPSTPPPVLRIHFVNDKGEVMCIGSVPEPYHDEVKHQTPGAQDLVGRLLVYMHQSLSEPVPQFEWGPESVFDPKQMSDSRRMVFLKTDDFGTSEGWMARGKDKKYYASFMKIIVPEIAPGDIKKKRIKEVARVMHTLEEWNKFHAMFLDKHAKFRDLVFEPVAVEKILQSPAEKSS